MINIDSNTLAFGSLFFDDDPKRDITINIDLDQSPAKKTVRVPKSYRSRTLFGQNLDREILAEGSIFLRQGKDLTIKDVINA